MQNARPLVRTLSAAALSLAASCASVRGVRPATTPCVAEHSAAPSAPSVTFDGPGLRASVALSMGAVEPGREAHVFGLITLEGEMAPTHPARPLAIVAVLDTSATMAGNDSERSRSALLEMLRRMHDDDRVAVITFNDTAVVAQPLARVGDVRDHARGAVVGWRANGSSAGLRAAVAAAEAQLAAAPPTSIERIVLVSNGRHGGDADVEALSASLDDGANHGRALWALDTGDPREDRFLGRLTLEGAGHYDELFSHPNVASFLASFLATPAASAQYVSLSPEVPLGWRIDGIYGLHRPTRGGSESLPLYVGTVGPGTLRRVAISVAIAPDAPNAGALRVNVSYVSGWDGAARSLRSGPLTLARAADAAQANASIHPSVYTDVINAISEASAREQGELDSTLVSPAITDSAALQFGRR